MNVAAGFVIVLLVNACSPGSNWPGAPYSEVRGYIYNLEGDLFTPILVDGQLHSSVLDTNGVPVTPAQVQRLLAAIARGHPDHPVARCYIPRHAFVFYDENRTPIAFVEICFDCSNYRSWPELSRPFDLAALEQLCRDVGLPVLSGSEQYETLRNSADGPDA